MSKGYWIVSLTIADDVPYQQYVAANAAIFQKWSGRFLVRGGAFETLHGRSGARQVVLEFDSYDAAQNCYRSPEYQAALQLLLAAATVQFVIVEGV